MIELYNSLGLAYLSMDISEAIVLSDSNGAKLLLMDEARGRKVAKQMGIQLMGTIGILLAAYKGDKLTKEEILECVETLSHSGRHISTNA